MPGPAYAGSLPRRPGLKPELVRHPWAACLEEGNHWDLACGNVEEEAEESAGYKVLPGGFRLSWDGGSSNRVHWKNSQREEVAEPDLAESSRSALPPNQTQGWRYRLAIEVAQSIGHPRKPVSYQGPTGMGSGLCSWKEWTAALYQTFPSICLERIDRWPLHTRVPGFPIRQRGKRTSGVLSISRWLSFLQYITLASPCMNEVWRILISG